MMKMEISGVFLRRDDEVIIIDPEHEYVPLAHAFGGQAIKVSAGSGVCVNPMDIMLEETGDGDPVRDKTASVVAMIGALIGGMDGLNAVERKRNWTGPRAACTRVTGTRRAHAPVGRPARHAGGKRRAGGAPVGGRPTRT